jgi:hypothetical protein
MTGNGIWKQECSAYAVLHGQREEAPATLKPALYRSALPRRGGTFAMWVPLLLSSPCNSPWFLDPITSINNTGSHALKKKAGALTWFYGFPLHGAILSVHFLDAAQDDVTKQIRGLHKRSSFKQSPYVQSQMTIVS